MHVTIIDSTDIPSPESRSVIQALASRSLKPISEHLSTVTQSKTEDFTKKHIIGYGHDSVHENADGIIISCSDVSILAAKALEDFSLFKGTEASTRYIDFSKQPFIGAKDQHYTVLEIMRSFYLTNLPVLEDYLKTQYPIDAAMDRAVYTKAIKAKTFDIMRGFLPAGATTMVNWTTDIRTAKRQVVMLITHPLEEISNIGKEIHHALLQRYPVSMQGVDLDIQTHIAKFNSEYHYFEECPSYSTADLWTNPEYEYGKFDVEYIDSDIKNIEVNYPSLQTRPKGCPPPRIYASRFNVAGLIDYGSFRDIQRQRNGVCKIPILTTSNGFENWYLEQLPLDLQTKAKEFLEFIEEQMDNEFLDQYIVPIGYRVPFLLDYSLEQMIYVSELRSSKHVHPTARNVGLHIADFLEEKLPFVKLYIDRSEPEFNINRGLQDIVVNKNA